jgi:hypothetical protein
VSIETVPAGLERKSSERASRRAGESVKETRDWKRWTGRTDGTGGKTTGKSEGTRDVGMEGCQSNVKTVEEDRIAGTTFNNRLIFHGWPHHDRGRRYDEREHIDQPRFLHHFKLSPQLHDLDGTTDYPRSTCSWTTIPPIRTALSGDQLPCGTTTNQSQSSNLCTRQKDNMQYRLSQQLIGSIASALGMSILSLSTTKRRYPPTPPSFDIQHGLYRSISHWHTSTNRIKN